MPREKQEPYDHGPLASDRTPENRVEVRVDHEGYVVGGRILKANEGEEFWKAMLRTRDTYPIDPMDIVMPPLWPVDTDGRGLTVLEVERQEHLTNKEKAA